MTVQNHPTTLVRVCQQGRQLAVWLGVAVILLTPHATLAEDRRPEVAALFAGVRGSNDVVLVADGSWSMRDVFRGQIQPALPGLIGELADGDHFSLLRFANFASEALPDRTLSPDTRAVLQREAAKLAEPMPTDTRTDLGAAIERTLGELTRPGFSPTQIVIFISDFCHEPPAGSRYSARPIPADPRRCYFLPSDSLVDTAQRVLLGHRVRVIALALEDSNSQGFEAFRRVFPGAYRVDVTGAGLGSYFDRLRREIAYERLAALVADELKHAQPTAVLEVPPQAVKAGSAVPFDVRVGNPMPHLSLRVVVRHAALADPGAGFDLSVTSEPLIVAPGATGLVKGTLLVHSRPTSWRLKRAVGLAQEATIELAITAEPATGIAQLNLEPGLPAVRLSERVVVKVWQGWSAGVVLAALAAAVAGVALAAVAVLGWFRRRRPAPLDGRLTVFLPDGPATLDLTGMLVAVAGSAAGCDLKIPDAVPQALRFFARRGGLSGGQVLARIDVHQACRINGQAAGAGSVWAGGRGTRIEVAGTTLRWD